MNNISDIKPKDSHQFVPFELDPNALRMLIQEQAGTWEKAIAELVMNSVDAGATEVKISYSCGADGSRLSEIEVLDDGKGFHNEDQLNFFKVFGAPHAEGDAYYGRYRIGRGQVLNIGKVAWRSHNYEMKVDLGDPHKKEIALEKIGFNLKYFEEKMTGCEVKVEFFNPIYLHRSRDLQGDSQTKRLFDSFIKLVKFVPIPVYINGLRINHDYSTIKWTYEDEDAYYLIQTMSDTRFKDLKENMAVLSVYNRGVFVQDFPATHMGCCGVIVSKKQLKLNMARNALVQNDWGWMGIAHNIRKLSDDAFTKTIKMPKTDDERAVIINQIYQDMSFAITKTTDQLQHFLHMPLFKMQNGNLVSIIYLLDNYSLFTVCSDEKNDGRSTVSELLEKKKKVVVIDRDFLGSDYVYGPCLEEDFEMNAGPIFTNFFCNLVGITAIENADKVQDFLDEKLGTEYLYKHELNRDTIIGLGKCAKAKFEISLSRSNWAIKYEWYEALARGLNVTYSELKLAELNDEELACFKAIRRMNAKFKEYNFSERKLKLGSSDHALAWTDSLSTIWITKPVLHLLRENQFTRVLQILIHEYCHSTGSLDTHESHKHDVVFYEKYHNLVMKLPMDSFSDLLKAKYIKWLADSKTRPSAAVAYSLDREHDSYPKLVRKNTVGMEEKRKKRGY